MCVLHLLCEESIRDEAPSSPGVHVRRERGERGQVDDGGWRRILDRGGGRRGRRRVRGRQRRVTGRAQALRVLTQSLAHPVVIVSFSFARSRTLPFHRYFFCCLATKLTKLIVILCVYVSFFVVVC